MRRPSKPKVVLRCFVCGELRRLDRYGRFFAHRGNGVKDKQFPLTLKNGEVIQLCAGSGKTPSGETKHRYN